MDNLALVVNTNSNYKDIWPMFYGQLSKYYPNINTYTFTDKDEDLLYGGIHLIYDNTTSFRDQYLNCIKKVSEKYIITLNDDYILYNYVDFDKIKNYINILETTDYSFIRFTATDQTRNESRYIKGLWKIPFYNPNIYSQTTSIWKTKTLEKIYEKGPQLHIGTKGDTDGHFEVSANQTCMSLGIEGLCYWDGEPKRGQAHYDNDIVPYIASALIKGKWNTKEYSKELLPLIKKYNIDISIRGCYE